MYRIGIVIPTKRNSIRKLRIKYKSTKINEARANSCSKKASLNHFNRECEKVGSHGNYGASKSSRGWLLRQNIASEIENYRAITRET